MLDRSSPAAPGFLVTTAVLLLAAMTGMANATISPSLPGLREHYADVPSIESLSGLVVTLPSLAVVLTAGLMGWLADRFDRQRLLLASGLLYALGGTSGLWVDGITATLAGRMVLGVGVAGTMVIASTWAADLWQGEARARFLGRQGAATSAGGIAVILIGGALAALHWRGAFATYLFVAPVTLLGLWALAPYARGRSEAPQARADADAATGPFPWSAFALVGTLEFLLMTVFYVMPTQLPFLLGEAGVTDPLLLSAVISLVTAAALPGALAYGRLAQALPALAIFALSWGLMGAGMLILSVAPGVPLTVAGVVVVGLGLGPAIPGYTATLMAVVPEASRGRASGLLTTAIFAGQFASPLLSGLLIATFGLAGAFQTLAVAKLALAALLAFTAVCGAPQKAPA